MGFWGSLFGAYLAALLIKTLLNFGPVHWFFEFFLGIALMTSSLTVIIFALNYFNLWAIFSHTKQTGEQWWGDVVGRNNKFRSWGIFLIILGMLRIRMVEIVFPIPGIISWLTNLLGLSNEGSLYLIGFIQHPELGVLQFLAGVILILYSFWHGMKMKALQQGRVAEFPLLGWLRKKREGIGEREKRMEAALYENLEEIAPLVEHEYKAVIIKRHKLENRLKKKKPIPQHVYDELGRIEKDIKDRVIMKIVEKGGIEHELLDEIARRAVAGGTAPEKIPELKAKVALRYVKQMTLPGSKKYLREDQKIRKRTEGTQNVQQPRSR